MKKVTSIFLALTILISCFVTSGITASATANDGSSFPKAISITDAIKDGNPISANSKRYYKFTLDSHGTLTFNYTSTSSYTYICIYTEGPIAGTANDSYFNKVGLNSYGNVSWHLSKGNYYICVYDSYNDPSFELRPLFTSYNHNIPEPNNSWTIVENNPNNQVSLNKRYYGMFSWTDNVDCMWFEVKQAGEVAINYMSSDCGNLQITPDIHYNTNQYYYNNIIYENTTKYIYLSPGKYYLKISSYYDKKYKYDFALNFTSANETLAEPNNSFDQAKNINSYISKEKTIKGCLTETDYVDYMYFKITNSYCLNYNYSGQDFKINIYNKGATSPFVSTSEDSAWYYLSPGEYYVSINQDYRAYTGFYSIIFYLTDKVTVNVDRGCNDEDTALYVKEKDYGKKYTSRFTFNNNSIDMFKMKLKKGDLGVVDIKADDGCNFSVISKTGSEIISKQIRSWSYGFNKTHTFTFTANYSGYHYVKVYQYNSSMRTKYTISFGKASPMVKNFKLKSRGKTAVKLQWTKNTKVDGYKIYRRAYTGKDWYGKAKYSDWKVAKTIKSNKTTKATINKLKKNKKYQFCIVSYKKMNGKIYYSKNFYYDVGKVITVKTKK